MFQTLENRFDPATDLPSLEGKVIFVTGGTAGIGRATTLSLARLNPSHIYFTGRNVKQAQEVISAAKSSGSKTSITFIECDFQSLKSVKTAMEAFKHSTLDIFIGNAGIMAKPPGLSQDGWEVQFAVNHLAHAMILKMVLPALKAAAAKPDSDVRVVMVSSLGFRFASRGGIKFATLNTVQDGLMGPWVRYGQSKLGNVLLAREIARRYPNITAVSLQPGVTQTELVSSTRLRDRALIAVTNWKTYFTTEEGSLNQLWMAVGAKKSDIVNGGFYLPAGVDKTSMLDEITNRDDLAIELWDWTNNVLDNI